MYCHLKIIETQQCSSNKVSNNNLAIYDLYIYIYNRIYFSFGAIVLLLILGILRGTS